MSELRFAKAIASAVLLLTCFQQGALHASAEVTDVHADSDKAVRAVGVVGLAVEVGESEFPRIKIAYPHTPAADAGVWEGEILAVDGVRADMFGEEELLASLDGRAGSKVSITVRDSRKTETVSLVRKSMNQLEDSMSRQILEDRIQSSPSVRKSKFSSYSLPGFLFKIGQKSPAIVEFFDPALGPENRVEELVRSAVNAGDVQLKSGARKKSNIDVKRFALDDAETATIRKHFGIETPTLLFLSGLHPYLCDGLEIVREVLSDEKLKELVASLANDGKQRVAVKEIHDRNEIELKKAQKALEAKILKQPKSEDEKFKLNPTKDGSTYSGVYIPKDLDDCFKELNCCLCPALIRQMKVGSEENMVQYHGNLGMWMRNNWGLWKGSRLSEFFNKKEIFHPDDMSGIILCSFWRDLNDKPIDLAGQIKTYQEFWRQARLEKEAAIERAGSARKKIGSLMMGLEVSGEPECVLKLPMLRTFELRLRYLERFRNGMLLTAKTFDSDNPNDFHTTPYFLDLEKFEIRPIRVKEVKKLDCGVVLDGNAYVHGVSDNQDFVVELDDAGNRRQLNTPPGKGWLQLGIGDGCLIAVRPDAVYQYQNANWKTLIEGVQCVKSGLPPRFVDGMVIFRDEGHGENNKRMAWFKGNSKKLTYFDEDVSLAGSEGPRWEHVNMYSRDLNGNLWISTGENASSLLKKSSEGKYEIAIFNNSTRFSGELFVEQPGNVPSSSFVIDDHGGITLCGSQGIAKLSGLKITPLVVFANTVQEVPVDGQVYHHDWQPTCLYDLGDQRFLLGSAFGGFFYLARNSNNAFELKLLDGRVGEPVSW